MKLISMTDFVFSQQERSKKDEIRLWDFQNEVVKYAELLNKPLELGMFVPCDEEGNVLEEPPFYQKYTTTGHDKRHEPYQQAKERALFEGYERYEKQSRIWVHGENVDPICLYKDYTVEHLLSFNLTLTKAAQEQIGL